MALPIATTRRTRLLASTSIILSLSASAALAQSEAVTTVAPLIITTGSLEQTLPNELSSYGNDIEVIESGTVRDRTYVDTTDALRMETPGLYIVPFSGPFSYSNLSLQGSRTGDVLWLVDGVRINNRLYTGTSPADTLPSNMIERVEVLKGGQSLFYGTNAAAGVINIVTRGFSNQTGGEITGGADSNQGYHLSGYGRGALGRNKFVVYGSYDKADGFAPFDHFEPSATDRSRSYDVKSGGIKYAFDLADDLAFSLRYQHTDAIIDYLQPTTVARGSNKRDEDIFSANLDYAPNDTFQLFAKGYVHQWNSYYTTIENTPGSPGAPPVVVDLNTQWWYYDSGLNVVAQVKPRGGFDLLFGYDYQRYYGQDDVLLIERQAETVNAGIFQVRTNESLFKSARFAAGARFNDVNGSSSSIWNASGHVDVNPQIYVEGSASTAFLLPDAYELHAVDPFDVWGEPDLEPEQSLNLNLSLGGQTPAGRVRWQVTGFQRRIDNLITDDSAATTFKNGDPLPGAAVNGVFVNVNDQVKVNGFEAQFVAGLNEDWSLNGSYTQTDAHKQGSSAQIVTIPEAYAKAGVSYDPKAGRYGGSLSMLWTGDVMDSGGHNYGNYVVADLAGHLYLDDAHKTQLTVRVENLFDQDYATRGIRTGNNDSGVGTFQYRFLGEPRTVRVSLTRRY